MIHRFCISHQKPLLPPSWYDDCISLGDFQSDSALHIGQLDRFWHEARPLVYGAEGTYVLPTAIERFSGGANLIEISSYRKRILASPEGIRSKSRGNPSMRELSVADLDKEGELAVFTPRDNLEFLVAQPLYFEQSVIGQYKLAHYRRDILDYASLAVELGVLDSESADDFLNAKHMIPGGVQLGIYPRSWLINSLSNIELVSRNFLRRNSKRLKRYNDYQVRAVGFLSERLGSFLLIRHLIERHSNRIPGDIFGYMTVMIEGDSSYSIGRSEATGPKDRAQRWPNRHHLRRKRGQ